VKGILFWNLNFLNANTLRAPYVTRMCVCVCVQAIFNVTQYSAVLNYISPSNFNHRVTINSKSYPGMKANKNKTVGSNSEEKVKTIQYLESKRTLLSHSLRRKAK
jgi:hypothetical protein